MKISIEIDCDELITYNRSKDAKEEAFQLIKAIDDKIAEYEFTERLRDYFKGVLEKEDAAIAAHVTNTLS